MLVFHKLIAYIVASNRLVYKQVLVFLLHIKFVDHQNLRFLFKSLIVYCTQFINLNEFKIWTKFVFWSSKLTAFVCSVFLVIYLFPQYLFHVNIEWILYETIQISQKTEFIRRNYWTVKPCLSLEKLIQHKSTNDEDGLIIQLKLPQNSSIIKLLGNFANVIWQRLSRRQNWIATV